MLFRCFFLGVILTILGVSGHRPVYAQDVHLDAKARALAHYMMAVMHDFNGDDQPAIKEYEQSARLNNQPTAVHMRLGAYYARMNHLDEAVSQLNMVIAMDPSEVKAYYLLALIYSSQKKFDLAAASYESILKHASHDNPDNLEIYAYLGQLYYSQYKYTQAISQFEKILQMKPTDVSANYLLGSVYLDMHQNAKATEYLRKVLSVDHDHDGALNSLAYIYAQEGVNLDQAIKMVRKAIEIDPTNGAYYDSLGWVLYKRGFMAEALMSLQKAETYISDPIIYDHMGDVYKAVGEVALARKFWHKSLQMEHNQPLVSQKIEALEKTQALKER